MMSEKKIHEWAHMISNMAYETSMHNQTFMHLEQRVEVYLGLEMKKYRKETRMSSQIEQDILQAMVDDIVDAIGGLEGYEIDHAAAKELEKIIKDKVQRKIGHFNFETS